MFLWIDAVMVASYGAFWAIWAGLAVFVFRRRHTLARADGRAGSACAFRRALHYLLGTAAIAAPVTVSSLVIRAILPSPLTAWSSTALSSLACASFAPLGTLGVTGLVAWCAWVEFSPAFNAVMALLAAAALGGAAAFSLDGARELLADDLSVVLATVGAWVWVAVAYGDACSVLWRPAPAAGEEGRACPA